MVKKMRGRAWSLWTSIRAAGTLGCALGIGVTLVLAAGGVVVAGVTAPVWFPAVAAGIVVVATTVVFGFLFDALSKAIGGSSTTSERTIEQRPHLRATKATMNIVSKPIGTVIAAGSAVALVGTAGVITAADLSSNNNYESSYVEVSDEPYETQDENIEVSSNDVFTDMQMVRVPAGEFIMGSNTSDEEEPIHTVYLDEFWIDQTEVTNAQYAVCVEAGECQPTENDRYYSDPDFDDHPVVYVTWYQANAYCESLGKDLPTEAQWEKAARGTDGRTYPWGESLDCDHANYDDCAGGTLPIGSLPAGISPYGVYDMAGNVWEWTADRYDNDYYSVSPASNPTGPADGTARVLRGGSWFFPVNYVRSASRGYYDPIEANDEVGFRCVTSP